MDSTPISRRRFCGALVAAAVALPLGVAWARPGPERRQLTLRNAHTGEQASVVYRDGAAYDPAALAELDHLLRCHSTGQVAGMDPRLFDILSQLQGTIGAGQELTVISGYRSRAYNDQLRRQGRGVARNSLHTQARAIDIAVDGVAPRKLARLAKSLRSGGVGTYRSFVHLDTGEVRFW